MTVPVPSIDPPPGPIEVEARWIHAAELRVDHPGITAQAIVAAWSNLSDRGRGWFLDEAQRRFDERLAQPGRPDDVEALTRRLRGEAPEHRAARLRTNEEQAALTPRLVHLADGEVPASVVEHFGADFAARINATGMPR